MECKLERLQSIASIYVQAGKCKRSFAVVVVLLNDEGEGDLERPRGI
jgi:hypothetical protein